MRRVALLVVLVLLSVLDVEAATLNVNCSRGQTIGKTLTKLDRRGPNTINVQGTCVESVQIRNFEQLTLMGIGGAVIAEPSDAAPELSIVNSQDVVVRDLTIGSTTGTSVSIANCQECEVRGTTIEGLTLLYGSGTALFFEDTLRADGNYAAFGSYDHLRVLMIDCTVEPGTGSVWAGVNSDSIIHLSGTTVRGFFVGIAAGDGAKLSLGDFQSLVPGSDPDPTVVVEDNVGSGIEVYGTSSAVLSTALVRNNGSGIVVSGGSKISTGAGPGQGANISNNASVGVMVNDGSHADIGGGTRIDGTMGNGLVVVNNSTASASPPWAVPPTTEITGSTSQDVFCDATSVVSNAAQIVATNVTCSNLNAGGTVPLP